MRLFRVAVPVLVLMASLAVAATLPAAPSSASSTDEPGLVVGTDPSGIVERLTETIIATMRDGQSLGFDGRVERLGPVMNEVFDFRRMTEIAVGRQWQSFTADERDRLVDAFGRMSIATFAARFDRYTGQSFDVAEPRSGLREAVIVPTRLVRPRGDPVSLDFVVSETSEGVRVIDVYLGSTMSELAVRRSEYASILRSGGVEALIARIDTVIGDLRRRSS